MCFDRIFVQIFRAVCKKSWGISVNLQRSPLFHLHYTMQNRKKQGQYP